MSNGHSKQFLVGILLTVAALFAGFSPRPAQAYDVTHPDNLLAYAITNASSGQSPQAVDNLIGDTAGDNGVLFDSSDDQRLSVSGFDSGIAVIRYFTLTSEAIRFPTSVTIKKFL